MDYYFICEEFLKEYKETKDIEKSINNYFNNNYSLLEKIYFLPKKVQTSKILSIVKNEEYKNMILKMTSNLKDINLNTLFIDIVHELENELDYKNINKKVYVILGFNDTTIYSTKYQNEDVTVILLESTLGKTDNIKMLLAHEYTHWIREKEIKHDIFESCIGERFITEGIACNFSKQMVPNRQESYYTIVPDTTVQWVKNNIEVLDEIVKNELDKNNMMYDFFYMFAITKNKMPVRTGYVYGYLKVKEYMEHNNVKIKDVVKMDWKDIFKRLI